MKRIGFSESSSEENFDRVTIPQDFKHALCIGSTGSGKTASIILPSLEDRIESGEALVAYIYKGHEDKKIKSLALKYERLNDVIEIGKPFGRYINLLSYLNIEMVKKVVSDLIGESKDPYWILSASKLAANIVELLRKINTIVSLSEQYFPNQGFSKIVISPIIDPNLRGGDLEELIKSPPREYIFEKEDPSFKTLLKITNSTSNVKDFFSHILPFIAQMKKEISSRKTEGNIKDIRKIYKNIFELEELYDTYGSFSLDSEETSSGNNGVLQILNNGLFEVGQKEYINYNDFNLLESLEKNAIIIVDIEGLGKGIHSILLSSLLSKLSTRIRNKNPKIVSVFIDEANRVLSKDIDIHDDVLREANVELILAIQNEEQMIIKFGEVKWNAIKGNFNHIYKIKENHKVQYNDSFDQKVEFLSFSEKELIEGEYEYNNTVNTRIILNDKFEFSNPLPELFQIDYNIDIFEEYKTIDIIDKYGDHSPIEYINHKIKKKLNEAFNEDIGINNEKRKKVSKENEISIKNILKELKDKENEEKLYIKRQ